MASIRNTAQGIIEEAREGIAWIAFFKKGRGWEASCFWPDIDKGGSFEFEKDDIKEIKSILSTDRNAIFVNGYYTNLGDLDAMTRDSLASALRWQYDMGYNQLADAV